MVQESNPQKNSARFIWSIADLLRGRYKPHQYGAVVLPFAVLRRLDCVLETTQQAVVVDVTERGNAATPVVPSEESSLLSFYNTSNLTMKSLINDPAGIKENLLDYVDGFPANVRDIFEGFELARQIQKLDSENLLFLITQRFASVDLHPNHVSNTEMGLLFEELIRISAESSNGGTGEHFTPRDVISLMVDVLFTADSDALNNPGAVRTIFDPTAGTGGMLAVADEYLRSHNPDTRLVVFGQEINPESYAIAKADLIIKGQNPSNIVLGDSLTDDGFAGQTFDYCLANPPFGIDWSKQKAFVQNEHEREGFSGRFGPGLPRVSDGSLLFLLHMLKKLPTKDAGGGRAGIILSGSSLSTGSARSGESEIRRYLLENDLLEAIIALPAESFYNTSTATYLWVIDTNKRAERQGLVQLIDGKGFARRMRKTLGAKRNELDRGGINQIVKLYETAAESDVSQIFTTEDFGHRSITIEKPLRVNWAITPERMRAALGGRSLTRLNDTDKTALGEAARDEQFTSTPTTDSRTFAEAVRTLTSNAGVALTPRQRKALIAGLSVPDASAPIVTDSKGRPLPDSNVRDTLKVPLGENIHEYFAREVLHNTPDAWIDETKTKIGYEIPFTRYFFKYVPPRALSEIDAELTTLINEITALLNDVKL